MMKTELLSPAGNLEKLKVACHFGADAVYFAGKQFGLRAYAGNFTESEMQEAFSYLHSIGKKGYVTVNVFPYDEDIPALREHLAFLSAVKADGIIVSDPGVVSLAKQVAPSLELHLSTQANTTNQYAVAFWKEQGVSRVVLARELSFTEIKEIHENCPETELEAFVHGAMCISYSGRCLLSNYLDGRQSNRGACVQACRWGYEIRPVSPEEKEENLPIEQDERGTYILNSKDLNLLEHLTELSDMGVSSFKIEGRMKSEYYLATVINAYRRAMDGEDISVCQKELNNIAHRAYTTAYAFGENSQTVNYDDSQTKGDCEFIATVLSWENGVATVEMRNRFKTGEVLQVLSPTASFGKEFTVGVMTDEKGNQTDDAKLVQAKYTFACDIPLSAGDFLRRERK
ncbi:MAG: U32 family peptidase [Clostridia bacterium]|nr:U32 family peptidase [Clostridia bacterium]